MLTLPAAAADQLHKPVRPASKTTFADLLRIVFPAFKTDPGDPSAIIAETSAPIRQDVRDQAAQPLDGPIRVTDYRGVDMNIPGSPQFLMMFQVADTAGGAPNNLFALFRLAAHPILLDLVEAPGFHDDPGHIANTLTLSPQADAIVYAASHHNSSQDYESSAILYVWDGRVRLLYAAALLNCMEDCNDGSFDQSAAINTLADPGNMFSKIEVKVTLRRNADSRDSSHLPRRRAYRKIFTATYQWSPGNKAFMTSSTELKALEAFNQRNY